MLIDVSFNELRVIEYALMLDNLEFHFGITGKSLFLIKPFLSEQDACTGVHSACRREENGHNLDICVLRRLRLRCRNFLVLKWGGGLDLQIWDLNRAHETEGTVFPIPQLGFQHVWTQITT